MLFKRKPRALLLDDDHAMQRLVTTLLSREGFKVEAFLTGKEAIAAIDNKPYAVLLLDLMMPHEGGITVIRHLQAKNSDKLKRVVVLTASPESVTDGIKSAVAAIVHKPFEPPDLIETVHRIVGQS